MLLLCVGLLTACALPPQRSTSAASISTAPPPAPSLPDSSPLVPPPIELQGQVSIKLSAWQSQPPRGLSLGFFFNGQAERGSLALMTPLGSQVAQVEWTPSSATLRRFGPGGSDDIRRGSIEELSEAALGEALPLQTLVHWMQGQPDPAQPHHPTSDAHTFEQQGWLIDTRERAQGRILATRQGQPGLRDARIQVRLDP